MSLDISERWSPDDENTLLIFNHTEKREVTKVEVSNLTPKEFIDRDTLLTLPEADWGTGDNA